MRRALPIACVFAALILALAVAKSVTGQSRRPRANEALLRPFQTGTAPTPSDYEKLAIYFMQGFENHRTALGAGAEYPGMPSNHGRSVDRMEGFSRMAPLWAIWVASGRPNAVQLEANHPINLTETFRRGLLAGTDPNSKEYWGTIRDEDQRIVEASDIALSLWLLRDRVWTRLSDDQKHQVIIWLQQVNGRQVFDNNWHLFVVLVDAVLKNLAGVDNAAAMQNHYSRVKTFYRGEGWFSDGPANTFDYYNAWGFHYPLFWLQQIDPEWDSDFITQARREFVKSYRYLMTPAGFPVMGRSVCYRVAAPVPLVLNQFDGEHVDAGEARRAFDATWEYFLRHDGARDGNITQGYCGSDGRILDNYSGPASCLWGLRSLIAALYLPRNAEFWAGRPGKLPVEQADFAIAIKSTGWKIVGDSAAGDVSILRPAGAAQVPLRPYTVRERLRSFFSRSAARPENHAAKYGRNLYSSRNPFCGCEN